MVCGSGDTVQELKIWVDSEYSGWRLDQAATACFLVYSRGCVQKWIKDGSLRVDGKQYLPKYRLRGGEFLTLQVTPFRNEEWSADSEVQFEIAFEDDSIIVVNKPAGLVVHPAPGNSSGTLLNGLLYHCPALKELPRAGIVHRLDKDTTGLMVVAKTLEAHNALVVQLQNRCFRREYDAIVWGRVKQIGYIDQPIARHPGNRLKMAVQKHGKAAITYYEIEKNYENHTYVRLRLMTGRTHQIRVHMTYLGHPLVGDATYKGPLSISKRCADSIKEKIEFFNRQALHARCLGFSHPETKKWMLWESELPVDFKQLIVVLKNYSYLPIE